MAVDWIALPMDLLILIAMKLENIQDFIYFSVVCRCWSDVSSQIKHQWKGLPETWLFLAENNATNPNHLRKSYNPRNNKCYQLNLPETFGKRCWGTSYGSVLMIYRDLNVCLFNPIIKGQICYLSWDTLPYPNFDKTDEEQLSWFFRIFFRKIIMLKVSHGDHDEFLIVALSYFHLAFARYGDQSWTILLDADQYTMEAIVDIVGVDDKIFVLYHDGAVVYWNVKDSLVGKVVEARNFAPDDEHQFMTTPLGGADMGVYDMKTKEIEPFYDGGDMLSS